MQQTVFLAVRKVMDRVYSLKHAIKHVFQNVVWAQLPTRQTLFASLAIIHVKHVNNLIMLINVYPAQINNIILFKTKRAVENASIQSFKIVLQIDVSRATKLVDLALKHTMN